MKKSEKPSKQSQESSVGRRQFLQIAATTGAAGLVSPVAAMAAQQQGAARPSGVAVNDTGALPPVRAGSDFMVDVIKSLGFEYVAANPGSHHRSLHESTINYGGNKNPELLTCLHEEISAAMAHGYFKVEGKPMAVYAYGSVGLQHASMAVYSAFCDRVPVVLIVGNDLDMAKKAGRVDMMHSAQDCAAIVRDFTKWDDAPVSYGHFAESLVRAYKIAMTPPMGPVVLTADAVLQEEPVSPDDRRRLRVPKLGLASPPAGDAAAIAEAAKMLVASDSPLIVPGRSARTPKGLDLLVELAELLQAPVSDRRMRMNFPTRHPLYDTGNIANADLVLALEVPDFYHVTHAQTALNRMGMESRPLTKAGAKIITISSLDLLTKSNYQDMGRYNEVDLAIAADFSW